MTIPSVHEQTLMAAQMRAIAVNMGEPYTKLSLKTVLAAIVKHGGMYTLLDPDLMTSRMAALVAPELAPPRQAVAPAATPPRAMTPRDLAEKLRSVAANFFYKLVDKPGYAVNSELMAYITEPGKNNGVTYDEGANPSPTIPAAFTFVGQFIDHDLTFNGMNLTVNEQGVAVADDATPVIDLDSVYGARKAAENFEFDQIFNKDGTFKQEPIDLGGGKKGHDLPRHPDPKNPNLQPAYILDPRNDENQLILQIHLLVQRLHNKLVYDNNFKPELKGLKGPGEIVDRVRKEVVAIWQSFVLNDYMAAILDKDVREEVLTEIRKSAPDLGHLSQQYGNLKHKPLRDLVTGKNVVRMPHEFAIGFRFGHSQLRPTYRLNEKTFVLLFKDARHSDVVEVEGSTFKVSGKDDLRGSRKLEAEHVLDWSFFYPVTPTPGTNSLLIDHKVTARVFNLPETAIPDDIKYIGNLPHRNLIRGAQIGVVSGEELAEFYGITPLTPEQVLGGDNRPAARELFELDSPPDGAKVFKTPLWYYIITEGEVHAGGTHLGKLGSRLVGEVLAGALYYGNEYPYDDNWVPKVVKGKKTPNQITLRDIIEYVEK
jgi:hypothetical protein